MDKVPYIIVVGEHEKENGSVSLRKRDAAQDGWDMGAMKPECVAKLIKEDKQV